MNERRQPTHSDSDDTLTAAIYARVSSPNQAYGYSLGGQESLCRERCRAMGWELRYIFKEAVTAGNTARPKFQKMIEKAMAGAFDVVVFWKLDRFCRSLVDLVNTERRLKDCGVALHSVTEAIDTTTAVGRFNFRNLASAAELEREVIQERAKLGMNALAKAHRWPNPTPPLGYTIGDDGQLKIDREEAKLVVRIFEMYVELRSMPQIEYRLNEEGVTTKRGNPWSTATVKKVLDNEIYAGLYRVAGVEDYISEYQIVGDELYQKVRKLRARFKKRRMPRKRKRAILDEVFGEYLSHLGKEAGKQARVI